MAFAIFPAVVDEAIATGQRSSPFSDHSSIEDVERVANVMSVLAAPGRPGLGNFSF
jgi:hypothetical protein